MNFRVTAILFAVATVLATALLFFALTREDTAAEDDLLLPALRGSTAESIDTLELTRSSPDEQKLIFQKSAGTWALTSPTKSKVDSPAIDALIRDLLKVKPVRYDGSMDNLTTIGLSQPTLYATVRTADKATTIRFGLTTIGRADAVTFVATSERPDTPLAVRTTDLRSLFRDTDREKGGAPHIIGKWLTDFRQRRMFAGDPNNGGADLESIKLTRGKQALELTRVEDEWRFATPDTYGIADATGDSIPTPDRYTGVRPLLNTLLSLQVNGIEDYSETTDPAEYAKYALNAEDPLTIRIELKPRGLPAQVLYLGKKVERDGKPIVPSKVYCRLEGDSAIAAVPTDRLEAIINTIADPTDLRSRDLILESKRDKIDGVDSTFLNGFKLRRVAGPTGQVWALYGNANDPTPTQDQMVSNLLGILCKPRLAISTLLTPNDAAFAADQKKGELKIWIDSIEKTTPTADGKLPAEPKVSKEPITFLFGQAIGNEVFVRRTADGKSTDFKLPADLLMAVSRGRTDYVDPKLGSFAPVAVTGLVLFRKGERVELIKEPGVDPAYQAGKWAFVAPDPAKGKVADGNAAFELLNALSTLTAPKMLLETPTPEDLKKLGLDPAAPNTLAKLIFPDGTEKVREYQFGTETADQSAVHMRLIGKTPVFLVPKEISKRLNETDLTDKVVLRIDPKKVRKLFLNGWKAPKPDSTPLNIRLELQNGVWVCVEPSGSGVEASRVAAILAALEAPKAIEVVAEKPGLASPPEQGFGDQPLNIIAELEDKSSAYIQLGGWDQTKTSLYARTGNQTFRIHPTLFAPILEKSPLIGK
jgi:hypothetical protein